MAEDLLQTEDIGPVRRLTLNAPKSLNALSDQLLAELTRALEEVAGTASVRAVILRGAGRAFSAGHDLKEMTAARDAADGGAAYFADLFQRCSTLMLAIRRLPQPVIAQVHGIATAAGCQLVATADIAVAASDARFGVNGVNIGLFCSTPMVALSRNLSPKAAFELLTTGRLMTAEEALQTGLINRVVHLETLGDVTLDLAQTVAAKSGKVVAIGKEAFYDQLGMPLDEAYAFTGAVMARNMMMDDTRKGIDAFLNKTTPVWDQD